MKKRYDRARRNSMSLETRIEQIKNFFKSKLKVLFSEMISNDKSRFNKVLTFMGLLELLKQGDVSAEQKEKYGDITVELRKKDGE